MRTKTAVTSATGRLFVPMMATLAAASTGLAPSARAEVVASGTGGFVTNSVVVVKGVPGAAYERFIKIGDWWNPAHSYSQDGKMMSLQAVPGGCFCETLKNGGFVEHMRVIFAVPGEMLRLQGGLGPLQELGVTGVLTAQFEAVEAQTRVTLRYAVTGYAPGKGLAPLASPVDGVLLEQLQRYQRVVKDD